MNDKIVKVKRKHVNWLEILRNAEDLILSQEYWRFRSSHIFMSVNRCAYYVLKKHYSTTSLAYARIYGELPR